MLSCKTCTTSLFKSIRCQQNMGTDGTGVTSLHLLAAGLPFTTAPGSMCMLAHMTAHTEQRGCRSETHHQATKPLCTPFPLHTLHTRTPAHHAALQPSWRRALQASDRNKARKGSWQHDKQQQQQQ
jgi:hypothetical protein